MSLRYFPPFRLVPALSLLAGLSLGCASSGSELARAKEVEVAEGRGPAITVLEALVKRWPDSPEVAGATSELARLNYEEAVSLLNPSDPSAAITRFEVAQQYSGTVRAADAKAAIETLRAMKEPLSSMAVQGVLDRWRSSPAEVRPAFSSWACEGRRDLPEYKSCAAGNTAPEVDYEAVPSSGREVPDLSEVIGRFRATKASCTALAALGEMCGKGVEDEAAELLKVRVDPFAAAVSANGKTWTQEFDKAWQQARSPLKELADDCGKTKRATIRDIQDSFGADEFRAKLVWYESATGKSAAAGATSKQIHDYYGEFTRAAGVIALSRGAWATPECRDGITEVVEKMASGCSSMSADDTRWILSAVPANCPYAPGDPFGPT